MFVGEDTHLKIFYENAKNRLRVPELRQRVVTFPRRQKRERGDGEESAPTHPLGCRGILRIGRGGAGGDELRLGWVEL